MKKVIDSIYVEVNLDGWNCNEQVKINGVMPQNNVKRTYRMLQKIRAVDVTPRMILALETNETFTDKFTGKVEPVLSLVGCEVEDLKEMLSNDSEPETVVDSEPDVSDVVEDDPPKKKKKKNKNK